MIALLIVVSHVGSPVSTAQGLHEFGPVDEAVWDGSVEMEEESSLPEPPPAAPLSQVPLVPGPVDESVTDPIEEPPPVEQVAEPVEIEEPPDEQAPDPIVIDEPPPAEPEAPPPDVTAVPEPTMAPPLLPAPTPTPPLTPTPTPTAASRMAPASISPGSGAITGCSHAGQGDQLQPGQSLTATCSLGRSAPNENRVQFQIEAPASSQAGSSAGWQVMVSSEGTSSGWVAGATQITVPFSTDSLSFTVALRTPENAVANGATISTTLTALTCQGANCNTNRGSTTLGATVAPLGTDDMSINCSPVSPLAVTRTTSRTVTCRVNALAGLNATSLIVRSVTIPAPPTGWTVTASPAGTRAANGSVTMSPNQTLAAGSSWSFTITLSPSCTATASASVPITSRVANTNGALTGATTAGPATPLVANATDGIQDVSVTVLGSSLEWTLPHSFDERVASGDLTYQVSVSSCAGWSVSISAQPLFYSGPGQGRAIPANNLVLQAAGAPTAVSGSGSGVAAVVSTGGLGSTRKVLQAQPGSGNGTYQQDLDFTLTLPDNAVVGSYRTTITFTTAAGP